jgi:hypothetical protein
MQSVIESSEERALRILEVLKSRVGSNKFHTPWTLRRSRLSREAVASAVQTAEAAYRAAFGEGHQGLVFVTSKLKTQEDAHLRIDLGFENWARDFCREHELTQHIEEDLSAVKQHFSECICLIGRYCRRVEHLFLAQVQLIALAVQISSDDAVRATTLLDFVEHVFVAGLIPLGFEKTPEGVALQVFVCD